MFPEKAGPSLNPDCLCLHICKAGIPQLYLQPPCAPPQPAGTPGDFCADRFLLKQWCVQAVAPGIRGDSKKGMCKSCEGNTEGLHRTGPGVRCSWAGRCAPCRPPQNEASLRSTRCAKCRENFTPCVQCFRAEAVKACELVVYTETLRLSTPRSFECSKGIGSFLVMSSSLLAFSGIEEVAYYLRLVLSDIFFLSHKSLVLLAF